MISTLWLEKRKSHWSRLETLVDKSARGGIQALRHPELQELGLLYRQTAADLSTVREDSDGQRVADYLNQLLGRAHNLIYTGQRGRPRSVFEFYRSTYPRVFRATFNYTLMAAVLFGAAALVGFLVALADPGFTRHFLSGRMAETIERREMWTHSILSVKPLATSAIMTNNLSVAFTVFAMGITAGLGTMWMMVFNGLLLGVIGAACWQAGMSIALWSFVAPHGVLELPAIMIAGGAGLLVARGVMFPGLLPRRLSLEQAGVQAVRLLLGTIPLLVVAGVIEGFLSPTALPAPVKFLFAAVLGSLFLMYLMFGGRQTRSNPTEAATAGFAP